VSLRPAIRTTYLPLSDSRASAWADHQTISSHLNLATMVSVCVTCKGLQKNHHGFDGAQSNVTRSSPLVDTTLPNLRLRSSACRACALLLDGILLHHDRFASIQEDRIRVTAGPFHPKSEKGFQGPLSVELRWQESDDQDDEEHLHTAGHADLKLEFFTDMGTWKTRPRMLDPVFLTLGMVGQLLLARSLRERAN